MLAARHDTTENDIVIESFESLFTDAKHCVATNPCKNTLAGYSLIMTDKKNRQQPADDFSDYFSSYFLLFVHSRLQYGDFLFGEESPLATGEVELGEAGEIYAVEALHLVAEMFEHTAHNPVAARVYFDADDVLAVADIAYCIGGNESVLEFKTVGKRLQVGFADVLVGLHLIYFLLLVRRVGEFLGEVAVVGEQKQTGGVAVETTDGVNPFGAGILHQVHYRLAFLGVVEGGYAVLGLVEQDIDELFGVDEFAAETHFVARLNLGTQFGNDFAVDGHDASLNVGIGFAARADARVGDVLVEADFVVVLLCGLWLFRPADASFLVVVVIELVKVVVVLVVLCAEPFGLAGRLSAMMSVVVLLLVIGGVVVFRGLVLLLAREVAVVGVAHVLVERAWLSVAVELVVARLEVVVAVEVAAFARSRVAVVAVAVELGFIVVPAVAAVAWSAGFVVVKCSHLLCCYS